MVVAWRAFCWRLYAATALTFTHYDYTRVTRKLKDDLRMWYTWLHSFNGVSLWRHPMALQVELQVHSWRRIGHILEWTMVCRDLASELAHFRPDLIFNLPWTVFYCSSSYHMGRRPTTGQCAPGATTEPLSTSKFSVLQVSQSYAACLLLCLALFIVKYSFCSIQ